jgi:hypothetical protein
MKAIEINTEIARTRRYFTCAGRCRKASETPDPARSRTALYSTQEGRLSRISTCDRVGGENSPAPEIGHGLYPR